MRNVLILTVALIGTTLTGRAQIIVQTMELRSKIFDARPIVVPEGTFIEIVDFFTSKPRTADDGDGLDAVLETQPADGEVALLQARGVGTSAGFPERTVKFVGPLNLRVQAAEDSHVRYYLYYKIRDNVDTGASQNGQTVVIPEDETGNVEIILESSKDLITWTAANPGIYDAATTEQRFFRVRAVNRPE
jgi:hypothetical protein